MNRFTTGVWVSGGGEMLTACQMSTGHLMNTIKMCIKNPDKILSMIIDDVESYKYSFVVDTQAIRRYSSMSSNELREYFLNSPLFRSFAKELESRGVNVANFVILCKEE